MSDDYTFEIIEEIFTNYLDENKHRKTPERFAILKHIYNIEGHFDAEKLHNIMKKDYQVSLATVYNTLDLLSKCFLIQKHQFAGKKLQFEKCFGIQTHHHLVCTLCGSLKEFSDKKIRSLVDSKKFANFQSTHYSLYLYGICKKCIKNKEKNLNNK